MTVQELENPGVFTPSNTASAPVRIGYLVPQFPGQTHAFFWREIKELSKLGIDADIISTRPPPKNLISHGWSQEAIERTTYLSRPTPFRLLGAACAFLRAGPATWTRLFRLMRESEEKGVKKIGAILFAMELAHLARHRKWTHIHAHSCASAASIAMYASLLADVTYSICLHSPVRDYGPDQKLKWKNARFAIAVTRTLKREVEEQLSGNLPGSIEVAAMGVDTEKAKRQTEYRPWTSGQLRIFSCGRLNEGKRHEDTLHALSILRDKGIDAHLTIAGEDDVGGTGHRRVLEQLSRDLKLESYVTFLGAVPEERVLAELESAHVFVLASLHEAIGVAIMEAMAMQCPLVATRTGGVPELVDDGLNGLLVPTLSPNELAGSIERIAKDPKLARSLGIAAREKVVAQFSSAAEARVLARCIRGSVQ